MTPPLRAGNALPTARVVTARSSPAGAILTMGYFWGTITDTDIAGMV